MKTKNLKNKISALILATLISGAGFYGCSNSVTSPPTNNLSFSSMSSTDSAGDSQNIIVLDTVKILIKDIKLDLDASSEDSSQFQIGPFVLFLNMSSTSINTMSSAIIPAGVYEKVKFEVHKLNNNEAVPDPEFADANGRYSVIVKGFYLGNYFVYKSTKSAHQILHFPSTLPISTSVYSNITMIVKPYIWFIRNGGYLDPRDPANSNDIDNNIKDNINHNFKAFKDDDRNGLPD